MGHPLASVFGELNDDLAGSVPVFFSNSDRTYLLRVLTALPHPSEVNALLTDARPLGSTDRIKDVSITPLEAFDD